MGENEKVKEGSVGFFATLPGILTALAAVVTACGGILIGLHQNSASPSATPTATETTISQRPLTPTTTPPTGSVDEQSLRLPNSPVLSSTDPVQQLIDQCGQGNDDACMQIVIMLTQECSDGFGLSCDILYEISPIGSAYEYFGATCGGKVPESYADTCSEL
jgi:hypothetical protein